jgi:hypothetical protein
VNVVRFRGFDAGRLLEAMHLRSHALEQAFLSDRLLQQGFHLSPQFLVSTADFCEELLPFREWA